MYQPEFYVRKVRTGSDNQIFIDLYDEQVVQDRFGLPTYKVGHVLPAHDDAAYVIFERDHSMIPVRFHMGGEVLTFGDEEDVLAMSIAELELLLSIGNITIAGAQFQITGSSFELGDTEYDCPRSIIVNLGDKSPS